MNDATANPMNSPSGREEEPNPQNVTPESELISQIITILPAQIKELACEAPNWKVPAECLGLAALAQLGAALGNSQQVVLPGYSRPAPFNLVFVSDRPSGPARWLELLGESWLTSAREMEARHRAKGARQAQVEFNRQQDEYQATSSHANRRMMEAGLREARKACFPVTIVTTSSPAHLSAAIEKSFDRSVVSLNGGVDPCLELKNCAAKSVAELAAMLASSWRGLPFGSGTQTLQPGTLTLHWQTNRRDLRPVLFGSPKPWSQLAPPVIFLRQKGSPTWLPDLDTQAYKGWAALLRSFFELRNTAKGVSSWKVPMEALPLLTALDREISAAAMALPDPLGRMLMWLPELALPLALVLTLAKGVTASSSETDKSSGLTIPLESVQGAIAIVRWLARRQHETLLWIAKGEPAKESVTGENDGTDKMDVEAVMEAIHGILERRGPLTKRELLRSFHKLDAGTRDKALQKLLDAGKIKENESGRLEPVAAAAFGC